jgi:hypothetical protein
MWSRILLILAVLIPAPAFADGFFWDGNKLFLLLQKQALIDSGKDPTTKDVMDASMSAGYVLGIVDYAFADSSVSPNVCVPDATQIRQLVEVTFKYLKAHPERRQEPASSVVSAALLETFPCRKGGSKPQGDGK